MKPRAARNCLIAAFMILAMAYGTPAAAMTISLPAVTGPAGSEVKIPMNVEGAKGCGALQLDLTYDPSVLEVKGVEEGALLSGAMLTSNVSTPGCLKVAVITQQPLPGDGVVAVVSFSVKGTGKSPLGLDKAKAWEHANNLDMLVSVVPGQFTGTGQSPVFTGLTPVMWIALAATGLVVLILMVTMLRRKRPVKASPTFGKVAMGDEKRPTADTPSARTSLTCDACSRPIPDGALFCPSCGRSAPPPTAFCRACGQALPPGGRFCAKCGAAVGV